jgi:precorrin-6B methylase 2
VAAVDPKSTQLLLDVGGGSGAYTLAFLKAYPEMKATLFDLPRVIEIARAHAQNADMIDRITLVSGKL